MADDKYQPSNNNEERRFWVKRNIPFVAPVHSNNSFFFVDDIDIINSANTVETTGEDLFGQQQSVIDTWEGALRATGGALR